MLVYGQLVYYRFIFVKNLKTLVKSIKYNIEQITKITVLCVFVLGKYFLKTRRARLKVNYRKEYFEICM